MNNWHTGIKGHLLVAFLAVSIPSVHGQAGGYLGFPDYASWKMATYGTQPTVIQATDIERQGHGPTMETRGGGSATCDCWHEPDNTYTLIDNASEWNASGWQSTDDASYGPINLPFQFYLYGQYWDVAYININGNISFGLGNWWTSFTATGFPVAGSTLVGPFWADVDLGGACAGCNRVEYKITPTALYVNWTNVGYFPSQTDMLNTFQVIITDGTDPVIANGANVSFCYKDMQWTTGSANGGVGGFGGNPANVGANQGNGIDYVQFGRFDHAGTDYDGPYGVNDGISFLDDQYFSFVTDVTLANVPPVITGQSVCDTLVLCVNETSLLEVSFLSPEPDQITVPAVSAPTLSNMTVIDLTTGLTASASVEITPTQADVGYHIISFTGTDNGVPVVTSTLNVVLEVQSGASMDPASANVCDNIGAVDMYALIGGDPVPGGVWTDPDGNGHNGLFMPGEDPDGAYLYEVGSGGNCPNSAVVTMATTVHVDAGGDVTAAYCNDHADVPLFPLLTGTPETGGSWLKPDNTLFNGTLQPGSDTDGSYKYVLVGTTPCLNDTGFVNVTIEEAVDPGLNASLTVCKDADPLVMLDVLEGTPQTTGAWTAPGGASHSGTFVAATDPAGDYTYTVTAILPCPTLSSTLTIAVDPLPKAGDDVDFAICADGGEVSLFNLLGGDPDAGGEWSDPLDSAHTGALDPSLEISGTYTYVVRGPGTCQHLTDTSHVVVDVNPLPVVSFTVDPDSGCHPLEVKFTNTTDPVYLGGSCVWNLGDGSSGLEACDTLMHEYTEPGWYSVMLKITTPEGCTDHTTIPGAVLVDPAPTATFGWSPEIGTLGATTFLFHSDDPHAVGFEWELGGLSTGDQRQVTQTFPDIFSDEYEVCLNVVDRYGCSDSLCRTVTVVIPILYVPTAFSPNGDGMNEIFLPIVQGMVEDEHEFMIFDRWGQLVFSTVDANVGWDGRHSGGGEILPTGIYTWRLVERPVATSDKKDWFGTVTLLK